jgi:hypothetical protein
MNIRNTAGVIVFSAMAVLGVVGVATGHERSGLLAVVFGGGAVITLAGRLTGRR